MIAPPRAQVERFQTVLADRLGLRFDESHFDDVAACLRGRLEGSGVSTDAYLDALAEGGAGEELRAVARELTVGETYFFRNPNHFRALAHEARARGGRLRVLSAGCASGEEAYTIAMVLTDAVGRGHYDVIGIDVHTGALEKARRGRYSPWSMRATPLAEQERWFERNGRDFVVNREVRDGVVFEERNLMAADPGFWRQGAFDVVFCRNVLIYFSPDALRTTIARMAKSLVPEGLLFLGDAENLRGVSADFHLRDAHDTFYYQLRDPGCGPLPSFGAGPRSATASPSPRALDALLDADTSWVEAIQGAAQRLAKLTLAGPSPVARIEPGNESAAEDDIDAQIVRASGLVNAGQGTEAEDLCRQVLAIDEFSASAHYLLALCRELHGDLAQARRHDQIATYLDPSFAMPHVHLGRLERRHGDRGRARAELSRGLDLLAREETGRLLLFGGGFGREALMQVCRSELSACEAKV